MNGNVLITGSSSGLGLALANLFHKQGYEVYGLSRNVIKGAPFKQVKCNLSNLDSIALALEKLIENKSFEYVFLNAGILGNLSKTETLSISDYDEIFKVNFLSNKVILDYMLNNNTIKNVIGISSGAALKPYFGWSLYCTSKSAFKQLISCYAVEREDIRFINLAPGIIKTKMQDAIKKIDEKEIPSVKKFHSLYDEMDTPEEVANNIFKKLPTIIKEDSGSYIDMRNI